MGVGRVFGWWGEQLAALLPFLAHGASVAGTGPLLTVLPSPAAEPAMVQLTWPARRNPAAPAQTIALTESGLQTLRTALRAKAHKGVRLRVAPGVLLERDIVLPAAAEPSLGQVLRYEFDRLTPFSADDTYWTYRMTRRDKAARQLHLRLTLAPRRGLARLLDSLSGAGIRLSALEGRTMASGPEWRQIRLDSDAAASGWRGVRLHAALAAGLAVATIAVPFMRQSAALSTIDARLAAVQPLVAEATGLRARLTTAAASKELLRVSQARVSDPLQALAAVTDALPDDTWLTDLSLSQRHLTLSGQSEKAARLIARLATQGTLGNPTFTAPVTRASGERRDIFSISAEWTP